MRRANAFIRWLTVAAALACAGGSGAGTHPTDAGETKNPYPSAPAVTRPAPAPSTAPTAIPLAEVAKRAASVLDRLKAVEKDSATFELVERLEEELPPLTREIDRRSEETIRLVSGNPSLEALRSQERAWEAPGDAIDALSDDLTARVTHLELELERLASLDLAWRYSLDYARATGAPEEVPQRIESVLAAIAETKRAVEGRWSQLLTPQNRVAAQRERVDDALSAIAAARSGAVDRLLARGSPPVWSSDARARAAEADLLDQGQAPFTKRWSGLRAYASEHRGRFVVHGLLFVALVAWLRGVRRRVDVWAREDPNLKRVAVAFDAPLATAAVLAIVAGVWIHPQPPPLLRAVLFIAALVPAALLLRRLVEPRLIPVLYTLVVFCFVDQVRVGLAPHPLPARLLFVAQMLAGLLLTLWFVRSGRLAAALKTKTGRVKRTVLRLARGAAALFGFAAAANLVGYVALADLIGDATLDSAYVAVVLYTLTRIADGLIMASLRSRPLMKLRAVRTHRHLIWERVRRVAHWLALVLWAAVTLEEFSLRAPLVAWARGILGTRYGVGSLEFSVGHLPALGLTMWAAVLVSRFLRFMLKEDVYPRLRFERGVPYAISTILHYAILVAAFLLAIAALGYDLTTITVLAGAFGVGIAFGMQNIVNNFVSGLILLFERPVRVGDLVQLDDDTLGTVVRIGIRASTIRTPGGAAVIVPNGLLISDRVTNWAVPAIPRRIDVPVAVVVGSDPKVVIDLLEQAAATHPLVGRSPPPEALFMGFESGSLNFELRAWTEHRDRDVQIRSALGVAVNDALTGTDIAIASPEALMRANLAVAATEALTLRTPRGAVDGDA